MRDVAAQAERELDSEAIAQVALGIIDAEGAEALTMRRLAGVLGIGLATLYRYAGSRDDVVDGVAGLLTAEADVTIVANEPWQETIRRNSRSYLGIAQKHPRAFQLVAARRNEDPAVLPHVARVLAMFQAAGFTEEQALLVNAVTDAYNSGFALVASQMPAPLSPGAIPDHETRLLTPPLQLQLESMTSDAAFERGLDLIVAGIDAVLVRPVVTQE